ncbi:helix-turn-helix domain-containing protein [Allorhodopirellula solitaria]|uniref:Helix-turn-helix domain protein n=1 Tax=Allorhodopirellula solitaria TaxID=2527987 RepID=A0A5C5WNI3_9BACT|nr:helix-turn-helix domain-containing protein [Allorhodopirellula solitaria]TWT52157.1 Helix-turn-helix domain protein [Allorhodopirellula solitaria]
MPTRTTPWMTAEEAAEYLKYSSSSIRRFAREGQLEHRRVGRGDYRFLVEWLDAFLLRANTAIKRPSRPVIKRPRKTSGRKLSKYEAIIAKRRKGHETRGTV